MECNFKLTDRFGEEIFIFWAEVVCLRIGSGFCYTVVGNTPRSAVQYGLSHEPGGVPACFDTPKEAFDFLDKIAAKYPAGTKEDAPSYNGIN